MGMDYQYAGSASYPRFSEEICSVAKVFGGKRNNSNEPKYVFPEGTNEVLIKWFNNLYGDFNEEETKIVWEYISAHPEIQEISNQLWTELEMLVAVDECWYIY